MEASMLEEMIVRVVSEPETRPQLLAALLDSRIAVPLDRGLENGALPAGFKPLTLNAQQGFPVLAVFTTREKAAA